MQAYNLARVLELPYLITITGSDLFEEQYSANPLTATSVTAADRIICFDRLIGCQVAKTFAVPSERIVTIPQGFSGMLMRVTHIVRRMGALYYSCQPPYARSKGFSR